MAFGFDKEIDFLLRNAARKNDSATANALDPNHLDADTLAAFAENALPDAARRQTVLHLADCDSCRSALSNFILINQQEETVAAPETKNILVRARRLDWFKKLFAFPNIAYACGALAILLVATIGLAVLRGTQNREVAQVVVTETATPEKPARKRSAIVSNNRDEDENESPTAAAEASPTENPSPEISPEISPTPDRSAEAENLPPGYGATLGLNRGANRNSTISSPVENVRTTNTNSPAAAQTRTNNNAAALESQKNEAAAKHDERTTEAKESLKKKAEEQIAVDSEKPATPPILATRSATSAAAGVAAPTAPENKNATNTKIVAGKTFQQINGVWQDAAYKNQTIKTISRGSDEFRKLNADLQKIAAQFGSEVLIVWNGVAYQIK
jgi:hypothetical protein